MGGRRRLSAGPGGPKSGRSRLRCRVVLLDAGGVIVLPHRRLIAQALLHAGVPIDPERVAPAHYQAVRRLDRDPQARQARDAYLRALCVALEVPRPRLASALGALATLADRSASGEILWSEPAPHALATITALQRAGIAVLIVTNSDGHAAENLRDAGICHAGSGERSARSGVPVAAVIDSAIVGASKPDPRIFGVALQCAGVDRAAGAHVGDMLSADIDGAARAGILAIHLDPARACRGRDHRHIRSLAGIWRHVAPPA